MSPEQGKIGLSALAITSIKNAGVSNLSQLAFAVGQPGQAISNNDVDTFLQNAMGRAPTLAENAAVRRLAFESQTLLVASLRMVVEQKDDGAPKKIGAAERETRMQAIRNELTRLSITEDSEPSHSLLERACQIHETNTLKYLEPSACTSRSQRSAGLDQDQGVGF